MLAANKAAREAAKAANKAAAEKAQRERAAAKEEAERAARKLAHEAKLKQVSDLIELAAATTTLLRDIQQAVLTPTSLPPQREFFSRFAKELRPLAKSLGYDIVLTGNKNLGVIVQL
jgi:SepF-like predicted cell division protein (DUF552 family)